MLVARVVNRARRGRLRLIGSGTALMDSTYVVNAVEALLAALDHCVEARGQALVVTNGEPRPVAELLAALCRAAGAPEPTRHVPVRLAHAGGTLVESLWALTQALRPGRIDDDPPLTRFLVEQMSTAHWFDQRQARQALQWRASGQSRRGIRRAPALVRTFWRCSRIALVIRLLRRRSQRKQRLSLLLLSTAARDFRRSQRSILTRRAGSGGQRPERSPARTSVRPCSMTRGGTAPMSP